VPIVATVPKQDRSRQTRQDLIDAAVACLVEHGAAAPTAEIAKRAGVSHAALFRHFPVKRLVLVAAVEQMLARFVADFPGEVKKQLRVAGTDRLRAAVRALWQIFNRAEMRAVFAVYLAAHVDPALSKALGPVLDAHRASIMVQARSLLELSAPELDAAVDAVVYAMQGKALGVFGSDDDDEIQIFFERLARRELAMLEKGTRR
jgi:AcrR family transcriptional regulator